MSIGVELAELAEKVGEFGSVAYLVTTNSDGSPHVVSVRVRWEGDALEVGAGRHTSANVRERAAVTLLWAAPPGEPYGLIVDAVADPQAGEDSPSLALRPTAAVLHRTPEGDPSSPSCITILARA